MDFKLVGCRMNSAGSCEHHNKPLCCLKGLAIRLSASQGLCFVELSEY
jgi:hypothetical protein